MIRWIESTFDNGTARTFRMGDPEATACKAGSFDLSQITRETDEADFSYIVSGTGSFYINVCAALVSPVNSGGCVAGASIAPCLKGTGTGKNLGLYSTMTIGLVSGLPQIVYTSGQACSGAGGPTYSTTINFACNANNNPGKITAVTNTQECKYLMTFTTKFACVSGSPSTNPSGTGPPRPPGPPPKGDFEYAWIFVIVVCASFIVYLIVGMVYKRVKDDATGLEMIPNIDFWRDLPILVKDGFVFIFSSIGRCFNRGQYSSI